MGLFFITIPSSIPSVPKFPENYWGPTGPGNWNEIEKCPGGQRFCDSISNIWENLYTVFSPVVVTPRINTLPSVSTSQLNSPAVKRMLLLCNKDNKAQKKEMIGRSYDIKQWQNNMKIQSYNTISFWNELDPSMLS